MAKSAVTAFVLALAVGVGAFLLFGLPGDDPAPPGATPPATSGPEAEPRTDLEVAQERHRGWPHAAFAEEIDELKRPLPATDPRSPAAVEIDHWIHLGKHRFSMRLAAATPAQVVDRIVEAHSGSPTRVYTIPPPIAEDLSIDVALENVTVTQALDYLNTVHPGVFHHYMTTDGLVIGTLGAIQQAQIDVREREARRRAVADRDAAVLDRTFRPDFEGASIRAVANAITKATEVEVVLDAAVWDLPLELTWRRAEPVPLREVLDRVTEELGVYYRVKDGRVFLLHP